MHVVKVEPMVNKNLIRILGSLLADAESGRLRSIYFAGLNCEGNVEMGNCGLRGAHDRHWLVSYLLADANRRFGDHVEDKEYQGGWTRRANDGRMCEGDGEIPGDVLQRGREGWKPTVKNFCL